MRHIIPLLLLALTARAEPRTDIEFARAGGTNLTLDAFVPEGAGPFPACILVHGGGFTRGDKTTLIKPLFDPLGNAASRGSRSTTGSHRGTVIRPASRMWRARSAG